jgi:hypothetical protein
MGQQQRKLNVLECGQDGDEVIGLENESDVVSTPPSDFRLAELAQILIVDTYRATRRAIEPGDQVEEGRLAGT